MCVSWGRRYDTVHTTVHHPVRVHERECTSELLCEGTNIALRDSPSAVNDPVEKTVRLVIHCRYARRWSLSVARAHFEGLDAKLTP